MKKGQIILGAIALVVTAGSTVAFKVAKWTSHARTYVIHNGCQLCLSLYTNLQNGTNVSTSCLTKVGDSKRPGAGTTNNTFYTKNTCVTGSRVVAVSVGL
jgi:hypothetical protein